MCTKGIKLTNAGFAAQICRCPIGKYILPAMLLAGPLVASAQNMPVSSIAAPSAPSNLLPGTKAPAVTDIWVVFKTHFDLGLTDLPENVFKLCSARIRLHVRVRLISITIK